MLLFSYSIHRFCFISLEYSVQIYSFFSMMGFHPLDFNALMTTWTSLAHLTFSSRSGTRVPKFLLETNQLWICSWGALFLYWNPFLDNHYLIVFILKIQYDNPWKMYSIPLKEVEHNSPPFKGKLHMVHSFQRVQSENGKIRTMQGETLTNTTAAMWSRLISTVIRNVDSVYPWYDVISVSCSVEPNSLWPHGP